MRICDLNGLPKVGTKIESLRDPENIGTVVRHNLESKGEDRYDSFDVEWSDPNISPSIGIFAIWNCKNKIIYILD